ncbi:MAG: homoserine O-acetyltransferase [Candidatus Margulisiibacteriota bacterium]|nr:MAG: homoserine O-acetyltransferase [Candidatus Margulisbacteria bacterium GWD2_39_127]OGI03245.1 MAG: homoserine O-acetyltransferase [Candidatus Margulisbacteria bacterium GWF2_38_17]OGI11268.1 MAG: homoserine O-acetyltransferase [Candidatus Margulisbacteria bacterium GWE2_39_32]PZM78511.1 MAG: homoserine O-acetyltransferase [Candidatus Margulisiibacteriota bacterium]HAR63924.1 homoserine O-acetyltransferase [Candidatus Margulisiibacteriota bacterium]
MDQDLNTQTGKFTFAEPPSTFVLESGQIIGPITIVYETYGHLNKEKSNAVLICHALSGDAHAAGKYNEKEKKPGWWDIMIGPGKPFDTNRYYVICSNVIGGCKGSTGPITINPETGKPYGMDFPVITIQDMVKAQKALIDCLGIEVLYCIAGGSMGGMQVLKWTQLFPKRVKAAMAIATTARLSAQSIAFNEVGRQAIIGDPHWNRGDYYHKDHPHKGLSIARMLGHITYLSDASMREKFGRKLRGSDTYSYELLTEFQVESYLHHQGKSFTERFDANSYLYLTKAMDYFDLADGYASLQDALKDYKNKYLVLSYSSDWLFPTYQAKELVSALRGNNIDVSFCEIQSAYGHDSFLIENPLQDKLIRGFLENIE